MDCSITRSITSPDVRRITGMAAPAATIKNPHAAHSIMIERHEAKYVIPPWQVAQIREFVRPFCTPDPYGIGNPPEYVINTLQLDSPSLTLHHAKEAEAVNRFKLRVRTYGLDYVSPVFTEIKRKLKGVIVKSRAMIPREKWCEELVLNPYRKLDIDFKSEKEEIAFLDFVRLTREIGAVPVVIIRYTRESWISRLDSYARVTFDRNLLYHLTSSWTDWGRNGRWWPIDTNLTQNKQYPFSGVVLEIKTLSDVPTWIVELIQRFDLVRTGHCKYCNAVWQEGIFSGQTAAPAYAIELLRW